MGARERSWFSEAAAFVTTNSYSAHKYPLKNWSSSFGTLENAFGNPLKKEMDSSGLNRHNDHQKDQVNQQGNAPPQPQFAAQTGRPGAEDDESGDESEQEKPMRRSGRRKIKIEYIEDKNRRHITFSKRKAGIMKKVIIEYTRYLHEEHRALVCRGNNRIDEFSLF